MTRLPIKRETQFTGTPKEEARRAIQDDSPTTKNYRQMIDRMKEKHAKPPGNAGHVDLGEAPPEQHGAGAFATISPADLAKEIVAGNAMGGVGAAYSANQSQIRRPPPTAEQAQDIASAVGAIKSASKEVEKAVENAAPSEPIPPIEETFSALDADYTANMSDEDLHNRLYEKYHVARDSSRLDPYIRQIAMHASPERREIIERRLGPIDVVRYLVNKEVEQDVPIIPEQLIVRFRTRSHAEDLYVKNQMSDVSSDSTDLYYGQLQNIRTLTCSLVSINGRSIGEHMSSAGQVDKEGFDKKFNEINSYGIELIADLVQQHQWFEERVRRALMVFDIKNG